MNEKRTETMKNLPVSERPYEKAMEQGVEVLSDAELLAVILRTGTKDISARALAEKILTLGDPPGLPGLLHHTLPDYKAVRGIGNVKAIQLRQWGELSQTDLEGGPVRQGAGLRPSGGDRRLFYGGDASYGAGACEAPVLNTKNVLIRDVDISKGTVNASLATPRELIY